MDCQLEAPLDDGFLLNGEEGGIGHFIESLEGTVVVELCVPEVGRAFGLLVRPAEKLYQFEHVLVALVIDVEVLHQHVHALLPAALSTDMQVDAVGLPLLLAVVFRVDLAREADDLVGARDVGLLQVHLILPERPSLLRAFLVLLRVYLFLVGGVFAVGVRLGPAAAHALAAHATDPLAQPIEVGLLLGVTFVLAPHHCIITLLLRLLAEVVLLSVLEELPFCLGVGLLSEVLGVLLHGFLAGSGPGPEFVRVTEEVNERFLLYDYAFEVSIDTALVLHPINGNQVLFLPVGVEDVLANNATDYQISELLAAHRLP